jgi:hypothetical protein
MSLAAAPSAGLIHLTVVDRATGRDVWEDIVPVSELMLAEEYDELDDYLRACSWRQPNLVRDALARLTESEQRAFGWDPDHEESYVVLRVDFHGHGEPWRWRSHGSTVGGEE